MYQLVTVLFYDLHLKAVLHQVYKISFDLDRDMESIMQLIAYICFLENLLVDLKAVLRGIESRALCK